MKMLQILLFTAISLWVADAAKFSLTDSNFIRLGSGFIAERGLNQSMKTYLPVVSTVDDFVEYNNLRAKRFLGRDRPQRRRDVVLEPEALTALADLQAESKLDCHSLEKYLDENVIPISAFGKLDKIASIQGGIHFIINDVAGEGQDQTAVDENLETCRKLVRLVTHFPKARAIHISRLSEGKVATFSRQLRETRFEFSSRILESVDAPTDSESRKTAYMKLRNVLQSKKTAAKFVLGATANKDLLEPFSSETDGSDDDDKTFYPLTVVTRNTEYFLNDPVQNLEFKYVVMHPYEAMRSQVEGLQGVSIPYTRGFYLVDILSRAIATDMISLGLETVLLKPEVDKIMGYEVGTAEYEKYQIRHDKRHQPVASRPHKTPVKDDAVDPPAPGEEVNDESVSMELAQPRDPDGQRGSDDEDDDMMLVNVFDGIKDAMIGSFVQVDDPSAATADANQITVSLDRDGEERKPSLTVVTAEPPAEADADRKPSSSVAAADKDDHPNQITVSLDRDGEERKPSLTVVKAAPPAAAAVESNAEANADAEASRKPLVTVLVPRSERAQPKSASYMVPVGKLFKVPEDTVVEDDDFYEDYDEYSIDSQSV